MQKKINTHVQPAVVEYAGAAQPTNSPKFLEALAKLRPMQARFVMEYLRSGNAAAAARVAGYNKAKPHHANSTAWWLLNQVKGIKNAVAIAQQEMAARAEYDADTAMAELKEAMEFSRKTDNATALARCIELRAKLAGLLIDRQDVRQLGGFAVHIVGVDNEQ